MVVGPSAVGDAHWIELRGSVGAARNIEDSVVSPVARVEGGAHVVDVVSVGRLDALGRKRRHN